MTSAQQIDLWVNGKSTHNHEYDECCPDFSCCFPDLQANKQIRLKFKHHPEARDELLILFLKKLLVKNGKSHQTHIAGELLKHNRHSIGEE